MMQDRMPSTALPRRMRLAYSTRRRELSQVIGNCLIASGIGILGLTTSTYANPHGRPAECLTEALAIQFLAPLKAPQTTLSAAAKMALELFDSAGQMPDKQIAGSIGGRLFRSNGTAFYRESDALNVKKTQLESRRYEAVVAIPSQGAKPGLLRLMHFAESSGAARFELDIPKSPKSASSNQVVRAYFDSPSSADTFRRSVTQAREIRAISPVTIEDLQIFEGPKLQVSSVSPNEMQGAKLYFASPQTHGPSKKAAKAEQTVIRAIVADNVDRLQTRVRADSRFSRGDSGTDPLSAACLSGNCGISQEDLLRRFNGFINSNNIKGVSAFPRNTAELFHDDQDHRFLIARFSSGRVYLVDTTFRQFFETSRGERNPVGQAMRAQPGGSAMADQLLRNGWIELTDQVANLYGRAFLASGLGTSAGLRTFKIVDFLEGPDSLIKRSQADWRNMIKEERQGTD